MTAELTGNLPGHLDRRTLLGVLAAGQTALVGTGQDPHHDRAGSMIMPPAASSRENSIIRDATINIVDFGALPDGRTDNAAAFDRAVERGLATGKPLLIPPAREPYATSRPLRPLTGLIGMGRQSCITALSPAAFSRGEAIVHVGWTRGENPETCRIPLRDFRILGGARRSPRRSANPASAGFAGTGLLYDEMTGPIHATEVEVSHCRKGIVHANSTGHIGGTALNVSNCWYNLYWDRNTGDYRYYDCVFTGALFATYGAHGTNRTDGLDPGGIAGLLLSGCHGGFSPYGFHVEDGDGTLGLVGLTLQNSSFEQIGNAVIHTGRQTTGGQRVSCSWDVTTPGHSWTDRRRDAAAYDAYTITDDPQHPVQDVAVSLDLVQGGPLFLRGNCWLPGRSGYHTRICNLLEWVEDANGSTGYDIQRLGAERILSLPRDFSARQPMPPCLAAPVSQVAQFECPGWITGAARAVIELLGSVDNLAGKAIRLQVRLTCDAHSTQVIGLLTLPPGPSDYSFRRWFDPGPPPALPAPAPDSTPALQQHRTIAVELVGDGRGLVFAPNGIAGQVALTLAQG